MTDKPITHKSPVIRNPSAWSLLKSSTVNGVKCDWSGMSIVDRYSGFYTGVSLSWHFDWTVLKKIGVEISSGEITVFSSQNWFTPHKINLDFKKEIETFFTYFYIGDRREERSLSFEYTLFPRRSSIQEMKPKKVSYEEMFLPSELNDTILVIDGKKLHVNKMFLSYHSEFFGALFSANFKEGQMDEIPIKDITFEDFGLMMSTIYPKTVFPNDTTVEKLLQLADRFIIPAIIRFVEHHLIHISKISNEKKMWMADAYQMSDLMDKCLLEMNTVEKFKLMEATPEFKKLSDSTKARILERIARLL